jgi:transmembrane sensor
LKSPARRRVAGKLVLVLAAGSAGWAAWRQSSEPAGRYRTATGEVREVVLQDGGRVVLNTASAIDVEFSTGQRLLRLLDGEILVTTAHMPDPRPFFVQTPEGTVKALGTRFSVRRDVRRSRLAVFEGAVAVQPEASGTAVLVEAGSQAAFDRVHVEPVVPVEESAASWTLGMLTVKQMRLADLANELERYRHGLVRCHPDVAELRISGVFPATDTDLSLDLLQETLPVRVARFTRYWASIEPR